MKTLLVLLASLVALNAQATRYGIDERIYTCQTDAEAKQLGPNQTYQVHVIDGKEMTLTRKSDGKWVKALFASNGYYLFSEATGTLWPAKTPGYSSGVEKNGDLDVAYGVSQGRYEGNQLSCQLTQVISEYSPLTATELKLIDIGDNANLANGGYNFTRIDLKKFDANTEKQRLEAKEDRENCTWETIEDRAQIYKMIRDTAEDQDAADKIKALESDPGLYHMVAVVSDNDISCSMRYVWIYTTDGHKLSLMYSQGD